MEPSISASSIHALNVESPTHDGSDSKSARRGSTNGVTISRTVLGGLFAVAFLSLMLAAIALGVAVHNKDSDSSNNAETNSNTPANGAAEAATPAHFTVRVPWSSNRAANGDFVTVASPPTVGSVVSMDDSGNLRSGAGLSLYLDNSHFARDLPSIGHLFSAPLWNGEVLLVASSAGLHISRLTPGSSLDEPAQWESITVPAPVSNAGKLSPDGLVALSNTTFAIIQQGETLAGRFDPASGAVQLGSSWTPSPSTGPTIGPEFTGMTENRFAMSYFCFPSGESGPISICGVTGALLQLDDPDPSIALNITLGLSTVWSAANHNFHGVQGLSASSLVFVTNMDDNDNMQWSGEVGVSVATVDWTVPGGNLSVSAVQTVTASGFTDSFFAVEALSEDVIVVALADSNAGHTIRVSAIRLEPSGGQAGATLLASSLLSAESTATQYRYMTIGRIAHDSFAVSYDDSSDSGGMALVVCALRDSDPLADATSSTSTSRWSSHGSFTLQRLTAVLHVSADDVTGAVAWTSIAALDEHRFALVYSHCEGTADCSGHTVLGDLANAPVGVVSAVMAADANDAVAGSILELQLLGGVVALPSSNATGNPTRVDGSSLYFADSNGRIVRGPPLQQYRSGLSLRDGFGAAPSQFLQFRTADGWLLTAAVGVGITDSHMLTQPVPSFT